MPTCREVAREIASDGLERCGWWRRLRVQLHLLMCRHCRAYARQIRALGVLARRLCEESGPDEADLHRLEHILLREIDSQPPQGPR